ncbi:MAG: type II/IV secretion system protein, partial [Pirellulales bacterium]|nr:type II/IV secretion system protein [Pirellulales bacterium]
MARLGDILVKRGWITEGQLQSALAAQGSERGLLGTILVRRGLIDVSQLGAALSEQYGVPFVDIVPESISPQVVRLLPEEL